MTALFIATLLSLAFAAFFEAQMDLTSNKGTYLRSIPGMLRWDVTFWSKEDSWRRKWKNGNPREGEAFWGSSTFLVWLTDGWHLLKLLRNRFGDLATAIPIYANVRNADFFEFILIYAMVGIAYGICFEIFYSKINIGR